MKAFNIRQAKLSSLANLIPDESIKRIRRRYPIFSHKRDGRSQRLFAEIHQAAQYNGTGFREPFAEIVKLYDDYADAIVLVTDNILFEGDPEWVRVAAMLTNKPLIVLDIFLVEAQIDEAYINGADAIILIVSLLEEEELKKLHEKADFLGLDVIVEVQDKHELEKAINIGAKAIGINTRDINDLTRVELTKVSQLSKLIPEEIHIVAESGIKCPDEIRQYCQDAEAIIVGSALLVDDTIEANLKRFALAVNT